MRRRCERCRDRPNKAIDWPTPRPFRWRHHPTGHLLHACTNGPHHLRQPCRPAQRQLDLRVRHARPAAHGDQHRRRLPVADLQLRQRPQPDLQQRHRHLQLSRPGASCRRVARNMAPCARTRLPPRARSHSPELVPDLIRERQRQHDGEDRGSFACASGADQHPRCGQPRHDVLPEASQERTTPRTSLPPWSSVPRPAGGGLTTEYRYRYTADNARALKISVQTAGPNQVTAYLGP